MTRFHRKTPPDADVEEVFSTLYLLGNTIYMKSDFCDAAGADGVIVNCDMCERLSDVLADTFNSAARNQRKSSRRDMSIL